jgi:hypothetical protein
MVWNLSRKSRDISKISWKNLKPRERTLRILSLKVLDLLRGGGTLTKASTEIGLDTITVKGHIGSAIFKRNRRYRARKSDTIQRGMNIYENGKIKSVIVTSSKTASLIGKYYNDVKKALETGNGKLLKKYKKKTFRDVKRKRHTLEARLDKILDIEEAKEDPEFYQIYEV